MSETFVVRTEPRTLRESLELDTGLCVKNPLKAPAGDGEATVMLTVETEIDAFRFPIELGLSTESLVLVDGVEKWYAEEKPNIGVEATEIDRFRGSTVVDLSNVGLVLLDDGGAEYTEKLPNALVVCVEMFDLSVVKTETNVLCGSRLLMTLDAAEELLEDLLNVNDVLLEDASEFVGPTKRDDRIGYKVDMLDVALDDRRRSVMLWVADGADTTGCVLAPLEFPVLPLPFEDDAVWYTDDLVSTSVGDTRICGVGVEIVSESGVETFVTPNVGVISSVLLTGAGLLRWTEDLTWLTLSLDVENTFVRSDEETSTFTSVVTPTIPEVVRSKEPDMFTSLDGRESPLIVLEMMVCDDATVALSLSANDVWAPV